MLSASPREVTLVNIVGTIDLEQLRSLQGKFGVPDLKMDGRDRQDARAEVQAVTAIRSTRSRPP